MVFTSFWEFHKFKSKMLRTSLAGFIKYHSTYLQHCVLSLLTTVTVTIGVAYSSLHECMSRFGNVNEIIKYNK